ncbi:MAG: hypothetical protein WA424_05165 [Candidatus Sulfotelmatobacter sp.]
MTSLFIELIDPWSASSQGVYRPLYNVAMNQVERARRFAQLAYSAALREIVREFDEKRHALRVRLATPAGVTAHEEAKLEGEQITATIKTQLNTLLDGYELNGVLIDDEMAATIASEVIRNLEAAINPHGRLTCPGPEGRGMPDVMKMFRLHEVRQHVGVSPAGIRAEIDRRRFAKKPQATPFTLYHVEADKPRVYVNRADNSVSAVLWANEQLFADLRQKIDSCLRVGNERSLILEKLATLEQSQTLQSFAQRYSDFISAAANHILLLTPFNPALTEMLHQVLS